MQHKLQAQGPIPLISGLREVAARYQAFIIDIWGVVHNGLELMPYAKEALIRLSEAGKNHVFVTNTSMTADQVSQALSGMGLPAYLHEGRIITAGDTAHEDIARYANYPCFYLGSPTHCNLPQGLKLAFTNDPAEAGFILNAIGWKYGQENDGIFADLEIALARDLPMICTNPDLEVEHGGILGKCAGYFADWYEKQRGRVFWHGKPHHAAYEAAWEKIGRPAKAKICAIGDSLRTDITGAAGFGIDAIWNLDGTTKGHGLEEARTAAAKAGLSPIAILQGFSW